MTDQVTGADSATPTDDPLALRLNDQLGPLPTSAEDEAVTLARLSKTPAEAYERGYLDGAARERDIWIAKAGMVYTEAHAIFNDLPSETRQDKADAVSRQTLADLLIAIAALGLQNQGEAAARDQLQRASLASLADENEKLCATIAAVDDELGLPEDGCNSTGRTLAAIKELLHRVADELPRMLAPRNYTSWRNDVPMPEVPGTGADEADQAQAWNR